MIQVFAPCEHLSGQCRNNKVLAEAPAGSDGGTAGASKIVAIGASDAFDDVEVAQASELPDEGSGSTLAKPSTLWGYTLGEASGMGSTADGSVTSKAGGARQYAGHPVRGSRLPTAKVWEGILSTAFGVFAILAGDWRSL